MAVLGFRTLSWIARFTRCLQPPGMERVLRSIYSPDERAYDHFETVVPYDVFRLNVDSSSFIEWRIFFYGQYEPEVVRLVKELFRPGFHAIDVGANIGCHTLIMSRLTGKQGKVLAVEPHPEVFGRLLKNLHLNNIRNVEAVQFALADTCGTSTLHSFQNSDANHGKSSLVFNARAGNNVPFAVKCATIDSLIEEYGFPRIDFLKIDVEGNELKVLLGAEMSLRRYHPLIVFEYDRQWWECAGCWFGDAREFLEGMGYALRIVRSARVENLPAALPSAVNIFASVGWHS